MWLGSFKQGKGRERGRFRQNLFWKVTELIKVGSLESKEKLVQEGTAGNRPRNKFREGPKVMLSRSKQELHMMQTRSKTPAGDTVPSSTPKLRLYLVFLNQC